MRNLYYILILTPLLFVGENINAQHDYINNFYGHNPIVINPAATGIQGNVTGFINYRDQWTGVKDAPETVSAGIHGLITDAMGIGILINRQKEGVLSRFSLDLNYSYRIGLGIGHSLAFGISGGLSQNKISLANVIITEINDPALRSNKFSEALFKVGFGIHYNWRNLNLNISSPVLYETQEKRFLKNAFAQLSYDFLLAENIWRVQPSVLYRYSVTNLHQADFTVMAEWDRKAWFQAGYRTNKNILIGAGIVIKGLGIGYMYEVNRSQLSHVSFGSHEIFLFYETSFSVSKKKPLYGKPKRRKSWF